MTTRRALPARREHFVFDLESDGITYTAGVGYFADGSLAEIFLSNRKLGSGSGTAARDAAVVASICLQHAVPLAVIRHALTQAEDGVAAGPLGRALDLVAAGVATPEARAG